MKQVYKIDTQGHYVEPVVLYPIYDESVEPIYDIQDNYITIAPQNGLFKPKWTGIEWVEGATQEYIESVTNVEVEPSEIDILKEQVASQQAIIDELLFDVIPSLLPQQTDEEMI